MNRCIGFTKNNHKCRNKTKNNDLFCCEKHKPLNNEIFENGCFICMEKVNDKNEIIYFKCKHVVHKPCYNEWLEFSTYDTPICIICRSNTFKKEKEKKFKKSLKVITDTSKIYQITNILSMHYNYYNTYYNTYYIGNNNYIGSTGNNYISTVVPNYIGSTGGNYIGSTGANYIGSTGANYIGSTGDNYIGPTGQTGPTSVQYI